MIKNFSPIQVFYAFLNIIFIINLYNLYKLLEFNNLHLAFNSGNKIVLYTNISNLYRKFRNQKYKKKGKIGW